MPVNLKCGCSVSDDGNFALGENCTKLNCGECRVAQRMHPFGTARLADLMLRI